MPRLKELKAVLSSPRSKELAKIIYGFFPYPLDVHTERLINYLNSLDSSQREPFLEKLNALMEKIPANEQSIALEILSPYLKLVNCLEEISRLVEQRTLFNLFLYLEVFSRFITQLKAFLLDLSKKIEDSIVSYGAQALDVEKRIRSFCGLLHWIDSEKGIGFFVSSSGGALALLGVSQLEVLKQKSKNQANLMSFFIQATYFLSEEFSEGELFSYCSQVNAKMVLRLITEFPSFRDKLFDNLCAIHLYNVYHNDALVIPNKLHFMVLWLIHLHLDWMKRLELLRSFFPRGVADEDIKALSDAILLFDSTSQDALIVSQYKALSEVASYLERTESALIIRSTVDLQQTMVRALFSHFPVEQHRLLLEPLCQAYMTRRSLFPAGRISSFLPQAFFKAPSRSNEEALVPYTGSHSPMLTSTV